MFQVSNQIKKPSNFWCDFLLLVGGLLLMTVLLAFYFVYLLRADVITPKQVNASNVTNESTGFESKGIFIPQSKFDADDGVRNGTGNSDGRQQVPRLHTKRALFTKRHILSIVLTWTTNRNVTSNEGQHKHKVDASRLHNVSVELVGTTTLVEDVGDVWTQTCKSGEWAIQIPNLRNVRLLPRKKGRVKASRAALVIRESKRFQNSSLQITHQVANKFRTTNVSATELKMLSVDVDTQFGDVERCPWNSSHVFECIPEPLENVRDKTKRIAQLFYLMAAHFEELISFMRTVQNSAAIILGNLERANNAAMRRKSSRTNSKRKLKTAMQSLDKINTNLTRQLQQDRIQLETSSQQWQAFKSRINFTQDENWANAKMKFELAKWRWSCSRQALNKTQEKLHNWSQLDEELSMAISESRQENVQIGREMLLLFNGTNNSIVQLERYRNLTEDFTEYYKGAGHFFLGISSRISDMIANIPKVDHLADPVTMKSDLRKIKCDLDRNGRFVILTDGELLRKDAQRKIIGFVLGGAGKGCDVIV